ncbi:Uncharacterised protein [Peptoniphilus lacrimalis]|uniref:Uncharacterized protein n=1 Tax=Peptoniphilus lacrimalis TaxID=33031 RepID=A0A379CS57_9FIRM|nr:hypothetical protein [Peptoniphilus lacrimalis]SUB67297.1 Uncharacterised protein [Peptoniphilus lacrimalis]
MSNMNYEKLRDDLVSWLRERAQEAHAKGFIFGLSVGLILLWWQVLLKGYFQKIHLV